MGVADVLIRRINIEDTDVITRIQAAITTEPVEIDFKRIVEEKIHRDEDASFVAEIKGKVVGYMISYIVYGGFGLDKSAWIANFGVDPKCMGKGIGRSLAHEVFQFYRKKGVKNIFTSVQWDSVDLLSFFKTLGFDRSAYFNLIKNIE